MKKGQSLEDEINEFLSYWDCEQMQSFLRDIMPLCELYDVEGETDWLKDAVGEDNERNIRLLRTVYLLSRIAENHGGRLATIKINHRYLAERMEKIPIGEIHGQSDQ